MNIEKMKTLLLSVAFGAVCLLGSVGTVSAQEETAAPDPAQIDKWVEEMRFQFVPNTLQDEESNAASVQGYFTKTPDFPLWLMMDMGGALLIDKEHYAVNSVVKDSDNVWIIDLSCMDTVNGFFKLNLAIDSQSGEAALNLATIPEGDIAVYMGKIGPYEGPGMPDFKNEKKTEEAKQMAANVDALVSAMEFRVKLRSELYGSKSEINVLPKHLWLWDPRQFRMADYQVICHEKQNGIWYIRLKLAESTEISEEMYLDMAIDSWTGEVHYRRGFADKLRANWMGMVDGDIDGKPEVAPGERTKKK